MKTLIGRIGCVLFGLGLALFILEMGLWLFPVCDGPYGPSVNQNNPVLHFYPNRTFQYSKGPKFDLPNMVHTNNLGFVSEVDYVANTKPTVAIIGDSYVEALMVRPDETVAAKLRQQLSPNVDVFSFAASGAALSTYLAYARYARERFAPTAYVFVIVANDFDESLKDYQRGYQSHVFEPQADGSLILRRVDYAVSPVKSLARRSNIVNYLFRNLKVQYLTKSLIASKRATTGAFVGNTSSDTSPQRISDSIQAVDAFFDLLPDFSGVAPNKIVLVLDGIRPQLYDSKALVAVSQSYFSKMRDYIKTKASQAHYQVIDMQPIFREHYGEHGKHFEFLKDAHWNGLAHSLCAKAIASSNVVTKIMLDES